jgi:hypothetical protein
MKTIKFSAIFYLVLASIQALGMNDSNNNSPIMAAIQSANVSPFLPSKEIKVGVEITYGINPVDGSPMVVAKSLISRSPMMSSSANSPVSGQKRIPSAQSPVQGEKHNDSDDDFSDDSDDDANHLNNNGKGERAAQWFKRLKGGSEGDHDASDSSSDSSSDSEDERYK